MAEKTSTRLVRRARRLARHAITLSRRAERRARRLAGRPATTDPLVSIVLPIYNVEEYLRECLDSILAQTYPVFEVLVVDDGSPDGSRKIAREFVVRDPRVRIITRPNGGLGAARNTGVREATGDYLTFVDSDDTLPPGAIEALVSSAESSGSDIVVGASRRFNSQSSWHPDWTDAVHAQRRVGTSLESFLPLVRNLYAWDKLYRRTFWDEHDLGFREGVAYEDQPLVTQLLARAHGIDVIPDVVYNYRARDDKSSISQQTASLKDLRDRVAAWHESKKALLAETSLEVYHGWLQTLFEAHFLWYIRSRGTQDDQYWAELHQAVAQLAADAPQSLWDATAPDKRVLIALTTAGRRADVLDFIGREGSGWGKHPAEVRPDGIRLLLPFHDDPGLEEELFLLRPDQLRLANQVEDLHWTGHGSGAGVLSVSGWAFIHKIDLSEQQSTVTVIARNERTGAEQQFVSLDRPGSRFQPPHDDDWCDYRPGTFRAEIPLAALYAEGEMGDTWQLLVRVEVAGFMVTGYLNRANRGTVQDPVAPWTGRDGESTRVSTGFPAPVTLHRLASRLEVDDVRLKGRTLSGVLSGVDAGQVDRVEVRAAATPRLRASGSVDPRTGAFEITVPARRNPTLEGHSRWQVLAHREDRTDDVTLRTDPDAIDVGGGPDTALSVRSMPEGSAVLVERQISVSVDAIDADRSGVLRVTGRVHGLVVESLALSSQNERYRSVGEYVPVSDGRFEATLRLEHEVYRFGRQPIPAGLHVLDVLVRTPSGEVHPDVPLRLSTALAGRLPMPIDTDHHDGFVVRALGAGTRLRLMSPLGTARASYAQGVLRRGSGAGTAKLTRGILMRSYFGETATDNGVAIQRELERRGSDLPIYWVVQDHSVVVPDGGIPVVAKSREWYSLLGSVRYYVDNMFQPDFHRKPPGQVLVQTFHGYPFKVMGRTLWSQSGVPLSRIRSYQERAAQWDHLVSPASYATDLLTTEFGYDGDVLEIGYPRNDILNSPEAPAIGAQVRASLGVREDQVLVLYAPTFRDYLAVNDHRAPMADLFDFGQAADSLGEGYVLLVRGHAFNARTKSRVGSSGNVIDVTDYPEVSDLYLAADVAVVDYSSLRFDFGVTGKPMIFHVPDLARYQESRGWIIDFEPTAPGPMVSTTDEVVEQLRDLASVRARSAQQYAAFTASYLDLDDGAAARRFVDAVIAPRGDA